MKYWLVTLVALVALCLTGCDPLGGSSAVANPASLSVTSTNPACAPNLAYSQQVSDIQTNVIVKTDCGQTTRTFAPTADYQLEWPSLSADGKTIVFVQTSSSGGPLVVALGDVATGAITPLQSTGGLPSYPTLSPDGQTVAYNWSPIVGGPTLAGVGIYTVPVTQDAAPSLVSSLDGTVSWSPDGTKLAVVAGRQGNPSTVAVVDVASHAQETILTDVGQNREAAVFSPDGANIVLPLGVGSRPEQLWLVNLATKHMEQISHLASGIAPNSIVSMGNDWTVYYQTPLDGSGINTLDLATGKTSVVTTGNAGITGFASVAHVGPVSPEPAAIVTTCPTLKFFGVRGSGETQSQDNGFGDTIGPVEAAISQAIPGVDVRAIDYQALGLQPLTSLGNVLTNTAYVPRYVISVNTGTGQLQDDIQSFEAICPNTAIMLAGFSQGADVIDTVLWKLTAAQRNHIVATLLFGDPGFVPSTSFDQGDYDHLLHGVFGPVEPVIQQLIPNGIEAQAQRVPSDARSRTQDYCTQFDAICNANPANLALCNSYHQPGCPHYDYAALGWADKGVAWAVQQWAASPNVG